MNDQDEMFEAATELPAFLGCPSLGPKTLPSGFDGVDAGSYEKAAAYRRKHFSFGDGLFPIQRLNGVECVIERCVINGREFKLTIEDVSTGDQNFSKAKLRDNGKVVCYFLMPKGKAISEKMAHGALMAYVHNLSGSGKFHSRGGFLKKQIVRANAKQEVK